MAIILASLNTNSLLVSTILTFLSLVIIFTSTTNGALVQQQGLTLNLIHRDSPLSPLRNPSLTQYERVRDSILRSITRINKFIPLPLSVSPKDVEATVSSARGEYVMEVSFGTPPVLQYGIVDTGSDLIWTQCKPCKSCYKQVVPIFDPRRSSTYKVLPCRSKPCSYLNSGQKLCSERGSCGYSYSYGDQSHTTGDVATETLTFESERGSKASLPNITIGCGHDNAGTFSPQSSSLIGLGGGPLSLSSQLSSSTGGTFSYCLVPLTQEGNNFTSKIYFGTKGVVSGRGVVSTPFSKGGGGTFYVLTLEGISVGNKRIPYNHNKSSTASPFDDYGTTEGNIIIDSGTTLTLLPPDLYDSLSSSLDQAIQGRKTEDPSGVLQLCYEATRDLDVPNLTAHFTGADLELTPVNTFIQVSDDVVCLAIIPADQIAIYGNLAQINYLVGYDTQKGTVSFKPTDCTKEQ